MTPLARARPDASDPELLSRIAAGDIGAVGTLFDRYEPDIKRYIGRLGVGAGDADDLVQLTFLDVGRAAASFDGRSSARSWLFGLSTMVVRRHRRSVARVAAGLGKWAREPRPMEPPTARDQLELHQEAERARRALERLSSKKREVFVMFVLENASGEDVARALGIPVATVWTRLHHARRELRQDLEEGLQ